MDEATLDETPYGRNPAGEGWFVLNLGDALALRNEEKGGAIIPLEPRGGPFKDFGVNVHVLWPGEPSALYHSENAREAFLVLPSVTGFGLFALLASVILLCYGGGFGTMPAFCADYFGARDVGSIYGLMLTAWGFGSVLGPMLIAYIREMTGHYGEALHILAGIMLVSSLLPFLVRPPAKEIDAAFAQKIARDRSEGLSR